MNRPETPYLVQLNETYVEYQLPISVKAVIVWRGKIPLLKNERDEWELPGGKLDLGESPEACVEREIREELGWDVSLTNPFYAWVYKIRPDRHVFVLTYCGTYEGDMDPVYSHEHKELCLVTPDEVPGLNMPDDYKASIARAVELLI